jgi:spermidine synthase
VIALRELFQVPPDGPRFQVVQADGAAYVRGVAQQAGERFDVILLDGFHFDGQPEALGTPDFYDACRAALTPEGVLVVNMDGDEASSGPLLARLECAFDGGVESLLSEGGSNRVAFAGSPALLQQARRTRRQRLKALSPVHQSMLVQRGGAAAGWPILPNR